MSASAQEGAQLKAGAHCMLKGSPDSMAMLQMASSRGDWAGRSLMALEAITLNARWSWVGTLSSSLQ